MKCTVHGQYSGKVMFPSVNDPSRTDESFDAMTDKNHHVVTCQLNSLPIRFVSQCGLNYTHLTCLGVMRRFLLYWKGPVGPLCVRLARNSILELTKRIAVLASDSPVEFARKLRRIDDVLKRKATEFRQFLHS